MIGGWRKRQKKRLKKLLKKRLKKAEDSWRTTIEESRPARAGAFAQRRRPTPKQCWALSAALLCRRNLDE